MKILLTLLLAGLALAPAACQLTGDDGPPRYRLEAFDAEGVLVIDATVWLELPDLDPVRPARELTGTWEARGYHDRGDPWKQERYR